MNKGKSDREWAWTKIQAAGLRATTARLATLLVLRDSSASLTHAGVTACLADSEFDKASIYCNLNDLVSVGLLRR